MTACTSFMVLLLAAGGDAAWPAVRDRCDLIEVNHVSDEWGRPVLDQMIFWDWRAAESCYRVADWRLIKCGTPAARRDPTSGGCVARWFDPQGKCVREVRAAWLRETWTFSYDPELADRVLLPKERRRGLAKARRP